MKPTRILVVEDEGVVGRDVQNTLVQLGYVVPDVARTGEDALELVGRVEPDLVLMDIRLSGQMDGIETAARIKVEHGAPVIFLTALADQETIARAKATEPYGYLLKPFNDRELQSTVEMAVSRSRAQKRLEASEERFANTLRSLADGVIATDLVGNITFVNPLAEALTGWTSEEAIGRPLQDIFRITRPSGEQAPPLEMGAGEGESRPVFLRSRSGVQIPIEDNSAPLKNDDGSLAGLVVVFRKRLLPQGGGGGQAAEAVDAPLVGLVEGIADPLLAVGSDWVITFANPQAARLFEKGRDEIVGRELWDEFPASIRTTYYSQFYDALSRRERQTVELEIEERGLWFGAEIYPFGDGLLILLRDISARKEDEKRHRRLEKLESLGLLARGFAHDFNNLLTVLMGNISLAQMKLPEGNEASDELASAHKAAVKAQGRVHQLLTFAKGGVPIRQRQSISPVLDEFLDSHDKVAKIDYSMSVPDDLPEVKIDAGQVKRLVANLVTNAEQAMVPAGGEIDIDVSLLAGASEQRAALPDGLELDEANDYLLIRVSDTGSGVAESHLDKVFEPYFTTRGRDNATGIGLTVCESIARAHDGGIAIASEEGRGSTVSVALPIADGEARPEPEEVPPGDEVSGQARILVLEDEPLVRQIMVRTLESLGHHIVETVDGTETVARYLEAFESGQPFDLVITDLSIPNGMGGVKAIAEIRQTDPEVVAIVSSGYSDDPAMADPEKYGYAAVLPKPYQPNELTNLVDLILKGG